MYWVLTNQAQGFVAVTKSNPYGLALPSISIHEMDGSPPDLTAFAWDFEADTFARNPAVFTRLQYLSRFTTAERLAIRASTDPIVQDMMALLDIAEYVDVRDATTIQGVQYLVMTGLLTPERGMEVLN